jgi:hypothetical protein
MQTPHIHPNGSGRDTLKAQFLKALDLLAAAEGAMANAYPHGRDYCLLPDDAFATARAEHQARMDAIQKLKTEYKELYRACLFAKA